MSNPVWFAIEFGVALVETWITFLFLDVFVRSQYASSLQLRCVVFSAVTVLKCLSNFFFNENPLLIIGTTLLCTLLMAVFVFRLRGRWLVLGAFLYLALTAIIELLSGLLVVSVHSVAVSEATRASMYRFETIVAMDLLKIFSIKVLSRFRTGKTGVIVAVLWMPIAVIPLVSCGLMIGVYYSIGDTKPGLLVSEGFGFLGLNVLIFSLVETVIRRSERDRKISRLEAQHAAVQDRITQFAEARDAERIIRHDFKHRILSMKSLCKAQNYEELEKMIDEATESCDAVLLDSGNLFFDTVISEKCATAEKHAIRFEQKIQLPPQMDALTTDVCVMLSNALDNAIEACLQTNGDRFILFEARIHNQCLLFVIRNSIGIQPKRDGETLLTHKKDKIKHGLGLQSMKRTATDLCGTLSFDYDATTFTLRISFPLKRQTAQPG